MSKEKFLGKYLIATQSARGWINAAFSTDDEIEASDKLAEMKANPGKGRDRCAHIALYVLKPTPHI